MNTIYSLRDVARLFGLKESRLRYWAQTGFVNPSGRSGGRRAYTFADLVEIKAAKELLDAGIPLQRVRRNLQALRKEMPELRSPLKALRVRGDGDQLMVLEDGTALEPVSGQTLLDFEVEDFDREVAQVLSLTPRTKSKPRADGELLPVEAASAEGDTAASQLDEATDDPQSAYEWFLWGCKLDDNDDDEQAIVAYERAIALDPGLAAAHTNLGNVRYERGERSAALRCYETAVALDPDQPEALYNLANIYEEEGDLDMAIAEYKRALKVQPGFADAHFNLALTLEEVGGRQQAMQHWRSFLELTPEAPSTANWRDLAQRHLDRLRSSG
jgi:tetratricopeptide (TPR) repeat protein